MDARTKSGHDDRICSGNFIPSTPPHSRGTICPGFAKSSLPLNSEGAGNAGRSSAPVVACKKNTRLLQVRRMRSGIPRAIGFNGFLRGLPGDRAFLPPSPVRRAYIVTGLIPASRYQDATTSPSACTRVRLVAPQASIASRANVRDDAQRPLRARDGRRSASDLPVVTSAASATD